MGLTSGDGAIPGTFEHLPHLLSPKALLRLEAQTNFSHTRSDAILHHAELFHDQDLLPRPPHATIHHSAETRLPCLLLSAARSRPSDRGHLSASEPALLGPAWTLERTCPLDVECRHGSIECICLWAEDADGDD
jgi:hypothetical protein